MSVKCTKARDQDKYYPWMIISWFTASHNSIWVLGNHLKEFILRQGFFFLPWGNSIEYFWALLKNRFWKIAVFRVALKESMNTHNSNKVLWVHLKMIWFSSLDFFLENWFRGVTGKKSTELYSIKKIMWFKLFIYIYIFFLHINSIIFFKVLFKRNWFSMI